MHAKHLTMVCDAKKAHLGVIHLSHISTMSTLCCIFSGSAWWRRCLFQKPDPQPLLLEAFYRKTVKIPKRKQNLSESQNIKKGREKKPFQNSKYKTKSLLNSTSPKQYFWKHFGKYLWRDMIFVYQLVISNTFSPKEIDWAKWARSLDKALPRSASWRRGKKCGIIKKIVAEYREMGGDKETEELEMMAPMTADWESSETPTEF